MKHLLLSLTIIIITTALYQDLYGQAQVSKPIIEAVLEGQWQDIHKYQPRDAVSQFIIAVSYGVIGDFDSMKRESAKAFLYPKSKQTIDLFFAQLKEQYPKNVNALFLSAVNHQQNGAIDTSLEEYLKAVELAPKFAPAYYQLSKIYEDKGDSDNNLRYCDKAIGADPTFIPSYLQKGIYHTSQGNYEKAIKVYSNAVSLLKSKDISKGEMVGDVFYNLGWLYLNISPPDNDKAIEILTKAIVANNQNASAYNQIGITYKRKKMYEKAIKYYQKGIELKPDSAELLFNLGVSYYRSGRVFEAKNAFQKASSLDPTGQLGNVARQWLSKIE